jgi:hypothetical protein
LAVEVSQVKGGSDMDEYWRLYYPRTIFVMLLGANSKTAFIRQKIEEARVGDLGGFESARKKIVVYLDIAQNLHLTHKTNSDYQDLFKWAASKLKEWDLKKLQP